MRSRLVFTAVILLVFCVNVYGVEVSAPQLSAQPGDTITVELSVDDATGIAGGDIKLVYDPAILAAKEVRPTALITGWLVVPNTEVPGEVLISMAGATGLSGGTGAILELDFEAIAGGESPLTLSEASFSDETAASISTTAVDGSVAVSLPEPADIDIARQETEKYKDVNVAIADGYDPGPEPECVSVPGLGGMGFHYVNQALIDEVFDPAHPEALMYSEGGELLGIEYIVISAEPVTGFDGVEFAPMPPEEFPENFLGLHVWLYKENPAGLFAPFNPDVTCPTVVPDELVEAVSKIAAEHPDMVFPHEEHRGLFLPTGGMVEFTVDQTLGPADIVIALNITALMEAGKIDPANFQETGPETEFVSGEFYYHPAMPEDNPEHPGLAHPDWLITFADLPEATAEAPPEEPEANELVKAVSKIAAEHPDMVFPHEEHRGLFLPTGGMVEFTVDQTLGPADIVIALNITPLIEAGKIDPANFQEIGLETEVVSGEFYYHPAMPEDNPEHPGLAHPDWLMTIVDLPPLEAEPAEDFSNVFFMQLSPGLNMISLPLKPVTSYTARSFAEYISATVVIRYDETLRKFVGFTPAAPDDGFDIDGGKGYIVNTSEGGVVAFTGAAWTNEPPVEFEAAPPISGSHSAWAFVVSGSILDGDVMSAGDSDYTVTVRNLSTGAVATETVDISGYFAAAWADLTRKAVIGAGDKIEVAVTDGAGGIVAGPFVHDITLDEIRNAVVNVRLRLGDIMPERSALLQNYPNPFNPETWIPYHLRDAALVSIRVYNASGQLIRTLGLGHRDAGVYVSQWKAAYWDGKNEAGEEVASGTYFYSITAGDFFAIRKMVVKK